MPYYYYGGPGPGGASSHCYANNPYPRSRSRGRQTFLGQTPVTADRTIPRYVPMNRQENVYVPVQGTPRQYASRQPSGPRASSMHNIHSRPQPSTSRPAGRPFHPAYCPSGLLTDVQMAKEYTDAGREDILWFLIAKYPDCAMLRYLDKHDITKMDDYWHDTQGSSRRPSVTPWVKARFREQFLEKLEVGEQMKARGVSRGRSNSAHQMQHQSGHRSHSRPRPHRQPGHKPHSRPRIDQYSYHRSQSRAPLQDPSYDRSDSSSPPHDRSYHRSPGVPHRSYHSSHSRPRRHHSVGHDPYPGHW